jgi:hypothetical protein
MSRKATLLIVLILGCRGKDTGPTKSATTSLPPVFSLGPANSSNWDPTAGPAMLVALGDAGDSAAVVLPDASDSTMNTVGVLTPDISNVVFDLYARAGKVGSSTVRSLTPPDTNRACNTWPSASLTSGHQGWQVAFASGSARAIAVDSIAGLSSTDSASLAASLAASAASLPNASDLTFRRLPFRVRYAYLARSDSVEIVAADIVRALNEEANPRIEHIFLIGERPRGAIDKYAVGYYNRTAGAEETTEAAEVLVALEIGSSRREAFVINVESDKGARFGLIERLGPFDWQPAWWSASTDCAAR